MHSEGVKQWANMLIGVSYYGDVLSVFLKYAVLCP